MNVVITGSTRGIGMGLALEFLKQGHHVCINGCSDTSIKNAREKLAPYTQQFITLAGDVSRRETHEHMWEKSLQEWGSVDLWINNAGVNHPQAMPWEIKVRDIDRVLDTNLKGVIHGTCVAYEGMHKQGRGKIFNMEGLGSKGPMVPTAAIYSTSKSAVSYFTRTFAKSIEANRVQVGILSPGMVVTDLLRQRGVSEEGHKKQVKIYNILADKVETVAAFFYKRLMKTRKNYDRIEWLTFRKILWRFLTAGFTKRQVWEE